MKKLLFGLFLAYCFSLCSCGDNHNSLMTSLMNEKKSLEDSAKDAMHYEHYYYNQAKEKMRDPDTTLWKRLSDTSVMYSAKGRAFEKRLNALQFSIDSLEKMK